MLFDAQAITIDITSASSHPARGHNVIIMNDVLYNRKPGNITGGLLSFCIRKQVQTTLWL